MNTYTRRGRAPLILKDADSREILSVRGPHAIKIEEEKSEEAAKEAAAENFFSLFALLVNGR